MKKFIKNLLAPLALIAMLAVGAFSVNASEVKTEASNIETTQEITASNPYSGEAFYRHLDPLTNQFIYTKVGDFQEGECSIDTNLEDRCTAIVDGMQRELWGKDQFGNYIELYRDDNI
ncbi:hypothetical protein [Myroides pelagicus]|uniref:Uncharacterized protein n=1 Tax=Myroides pelagicus TaxID=270914 RepID=A0A7K1GPU3_9FLAO|nr:hypothetical protein [Myroides pelagicus]MTH30887.1 hypothetical protein [Myroides pelagicus]